MQTSCYVLIVWLWSPTRYTNAHSTDCLTKFWSGAEADGALLTRWTDCLHSTVRMCVSDRLHLTSCLPGAAGMT